MRITDHAVLRYLERVMGVDTDAVREAIKADVAFAVEMGAVSFYKDGLTFVLDSSTVITILADGMRIKARDKREQKRREKGK